MKKIVYLLIVTLFLFSSITVVADKTISYDVYENEELGISVNLFPPMFGYMEELDEGVDFLPPGKLPCVSVYRYDEYINLSNPADERNSYDMGMHEYDFDYISSYHYSWASSYTDFESISDGLSKISGMDASYILYRCSNTDGDETLLVASFMTAVDGYIYIFEVYEYQDTYNDLIDSMNFILSSFVIDGTNGPSEVDLHSPIISNSNNSSHKSSDGKGYVLIVIITLAVISLIFIFIIIKIIKKITHSKRTGYENESSGKQKGYE